MSIKIITDSAADLPVSITDKYNIDVTPLIVLHESKEYLDGKNITPEKVYQGMRNGQIFKTAQVPPAKFQEVFTKYARQKQSVLYLAFSSELSGTYQSAVMVQKQLKTEYPDFNLTIIDTKCASLGFGLVVLKAAKMVEQGLPAKEIIEKTKYNAKHMEHIFTVDDLEYLYRGGRVSRTKAFIGGVLNLKPILDVEDGKLIPVEKARGRKRVFKRILNLMEERGTNLKEQTIAISHGDDPQGAENLRDMIVDATGCNNFLINTIGAVIGAHAGPGTIALFFLNDTEHDVNDPT